MARNTGKMARDAAAQAVKAEQVVKVTMPTKEQLDREQAEAEAEELTNLEREARELADEQADLEAKGGRKDPYNGPMMALRDRSKAGAYRRAANGQPACGDEIAIALGELQPVFVIRACILALNLPHNPYTHLNIGQQSMNLRNRLRGALKRGEFGNGVVIEAIEEARQQQEAAIAAAKAS